LICEHCGSNIGQLNSTRIESSPNAVIKVWSINYISQLTNEYEFKI
jgi:hypothetical protein